MLLHYDAEYVCVCVEFTVYNKNYGIIFQFFSLFSLIHFT